MKVNPEIINGRKCTVIRKPFDAEWVKKIKDALTEAEAYQRYVVGAVNAVMIKALQSLEIINKKLGEHNDPTGRA